MVPWSTAPIGHGLGRNGLWSMARRTCTAQRIQVRCSYGLCSYDAALLVGPEWMSTDTAVSMAGMTARCSACLPRYLGRYGRGYGTADLGSTVPACHCDPPLPTRYQSTRAGLIRRELPTPGWHRAWDAWSTSVKAPPAGTWESLEPMLS